MKLFEILNFHRELLLRLTQIGYKPDDYKFIDMFSEYEQMYRNGDKVTYIVSYLSDKFNVSERKVYSIIKRFKKDCTIYTV